MNHLDTIIKNCEGLMQASVTLTESNAMPMQNDPNYNTSGLAEIEGTKGTYTFLYADIRGSADSDAAHRTHTNVKIYRIFHYAAAELIEQFQGEIRSFDGDRVLGVFSGEDAPSQAVACALEMERLMNNTLQEAIKKAEPNIYFQVGIGIATGEVAVIRLASNRKGESVADYAWVGDAANFGAHLSDGAVGNKPIYICNDTFEKINDALRKLFNTSSSLEGESCFAYLK